MHKIHEESISRMNEGMNHLTNVHLQEHVDRLLEAAEAKEVEAHLRDCERCANMVAAFRQLETELRRVPLETVSNDFTNRLMRVIRLRSSFGIARDVLMNLIPLGIVLIVSAVLIGIFVGPQSARTPGKSSEVFESLNQQVGEAVTSGISIMLDWIYKAVGLSTTIPLIRDAVGLVLLIILIKLFDEFVFIPIMRKRN